MVNVLDTERSKILVVDDHPASRMTAVALLSVEGYEILEADSGSSPRPSQRSQSRCDSVGCDDAGNGRI
ncbi:hypothetical protein [[Phormidium] sp. ETS-05]|uniref:hypothetical protein n=1 Tax=[Phormidium] sp. ETS-05 TaxID=222819 RepID=UPI001E2F1896|nr:hypothetical protein [[Phormidium] sp. ETS-05]